jgi:uncharacterized protein YjeT (DUF2065 family)
MNDFLVGIGLVLVIEGLLWALAPRLSLRFMELAAATPEHQLRTGGAVAVAAGVLVVWLAKT